MSGTAFGDEFPRDHAHAVGVLALYYNRLELGVFAFFQRYAPGGNEAQSVLFQSLHNQQRRDFIRAIAAARETPEDAADVSYAMRCFDICSENRNLIMHAAPMLDEGGDALTLWKLRREEPHMMTAYDFTLEDIRGAAVAADQTELYVLALMRYLKALEFNALTELPPERPQRPSQPRRLSLSQRQAALTDDQPQL